MMDWELVKAIGQVVFAAFLLVGGICRLILRLPGWDEQCGTCGHVKSQHALYKGFCAPAWSKCPCSKFEPWQDIRMQWGRRRAG